MLPNYKKGMNKSLKKSILKNESARAFDRMDAQEKASKILDKLRKEGKI
jgi:hypothetical protein